MLISYNKNLEPANYVDGVDFTKNSPCIWVVYPAGASGDLVSSIINSHYIETGSRYYGISELGKVIFRPSDNKITNTHMNIHQELPVFDNKWLYRLSDQLSEKQLNFSLLDQFIFSCHAYKEKHIDLIKESFPNSKIINIFCDDVQGNTMIDVLGTLKNNISASHEWCQQHKHANVLNIPFGAMFNSTLYYTHYDRIINFLGLPGRLVCFDYIEFYLSKQHGNIKHQLVNYSESLLDNNLNQ